eukprot:TRINITY_DN4126_c0_g1_i1.p1 TRINITY_DN4126_c0_g1~~TRINITY_DN4126_c0_g1_i1.p1  ORF type:complete len:520 (+),score=119.22 TRINITY_DN4126_c0_g1_i1:109-1668(+)
MSQFQSVKSKKMPSSLSKEDAVVKYWKNWKFPILLKQMAAITHVEFSPTAPHNFAVTSSTRVQIFDPNTNQAEKTISRFKDVAYSGSFRQDGRLLVAGGENSVVQLFDLNSRSILRTFRGHDGPVRVTRYAPNNVNILSASDDQTIKCWDTSTGQPILTLHGHTDYVRAAMINQSSPDIWVSGSYDHSVKLWDIRNTSGQSNVMTLNHGSPVEALAIFPGGGLLATAGSNIIKIWDIFSGNKLLQEISNHQKTITCLGFDGTNAQLLSGSRDHMVKVYDVKSMNVVHTIKYSSPILSLACSPDNTHLVVGMADGMLSIKQRVVKKAEQVREKMEKKEKLVAGSIRYFLRGKGEKLKRPAQNVYAVPRLRKTKLSMLDKRLKNFRYKSALDSVMKVNNPILAITLIEELSNRGGLEIALQGRDDAALEPILSFICSHISNPKYSSVLIRLANMVFDLYLGVIGQSVVIDELFKKIQIKIDLEVKFQKELFLLLGSLELLVNANNSSPPPPPRPSSLKFVK